MTLKAVIFDWDGVLIDTTSWAFRCYEFQCETFGKTFPFKSVEDVKLASNRNWIHIYELMGFEFPKDKDAIIQNFNKFAVLHPPDMNKHLVSLIKRFREDNPSVDLAIASSSTREIILSVLQRAGADGYFKTIVADEDIIAHKPDPEMILKVMDRLKIRKDESVYVGDIATDVIAAKRAGIMSIAVTYGFNSRDVLAKEHPDHIVDSPDDLFKLLSRICS